MAVFSQYDRTINPFLHNKGQNTTDNGWFVPIVGEIGWFWRNLGGTPTTNVKEIWEPHLILTDPYSGVPKIYSRILLMRLAVES